MLRFTMMCQMPINNEQNSENLTNFQEATMPKSKKSLFKPLARIVTSLLLITLGVVIGYRYALGNLPFNVSFNGTVGSAAPVTRIA